MITSFLNEFLHILNESAWLLLGGFGAAGLLHVLIQSREDLLRPLTRPGFGAVAWATLLGAPLPLCSCSVLPTATSLLRKGARKGAASAFLITVPETDLVSILLTWGLIGPFMAVVRPLASIVTGLATGLAVDAVDRRTAAAPPARTAAPLAMAGSPSCCHGPAPQPTAVAEPSCCGPAGAEPSCCAEKEPAPASAPWWRRALHYGFVEFWDDLAGRLVVGLLVGALVAVLLPGLDPEWLASHRWLSYLVLLGVGVPMYVCATASTPIAAGLIAGGVSPGAALVFLLVGPATNTAGLVVLAREFGRRVLAVHLGGVIVVSVAAGVLVDALAGSTRLDVTVGALHHHGTSVWALAGTVVFLGWTAWRLAARRLRTA